MAQWPDIALALLLVLNLVFAIRLERRLRRLRALQSDMDGIAPQADAELRDALAAVRSQMTRVAEAQAALDAATAAAEALRRDMRRIELQRLDDVPQRDLPMARGIAAYEAQAAHSDPRRDGWPAAPDEAEASPMSRRPAPLGNSIVALPIRSKAEQALEAALRRRR